MNQSLEVIFNNWSKPVSETEEQRISNAISMIRDAIDASDELKCKDIEVFVQGSYANNTNVRANSDVDVCIMLKDTFCVEYPEGKSRDDYDFTASTYNFETYRSDVIKDLKDKYGEGSIKSGNKSIKISENSYRVEADVVPAFQYRNYKYIDSNNPKKFIEGIKLHTANTNEIIINYSKIHIKNGIIKNNDTQKRYKRLVRIFKLVRYEMIDDGESVNKGITSFLTECLLWNTPDLTFNYYESWTERTQRAIIHLYNKTKDEKDCKKWGEVSEMLYLFHDGRKWNVKMTHDFLNKMRDYLGF